MSPIALLLSLLAAAAAIDPGNEIDLDGALKQGDNQSPGQLVIDKVNTTDSFEDALNGTVTSNLSDGNDTVILDGDHEEIVRKKRTFGDIVFRGLADVLGYNVARKPPQAAFPPPLAPVPGIDTPLQAAPAAAPAAPAPAAPAPAPAVAAPCGQPRAAAPPPCRAQLPPPAPRPTPPPCPRPRAAPRPKPRPTPPPPPPPPPPCASPRANPTTAAPCAPAPPPKADSNLETISSNFQLNFNFNRNPVTQAAPTQAADAEQEQEQEQEQFAQAEPAIPIVPIPIAPKAAKLPPAEPRKPRVFVDAFLLKDGVARRVDTVDAKKLNTQIAADDDYLAYDEENEQPQPLYDDYEDVQESRDRESAVQDFGVAVDRFWDQKRQQKKPKQQSLPANHYQNVHFGDRDFANQVQLRASLQRESPRPNRIPLPLPDAEDDAEATTTTEDPKKPLRPRVLPPTEHNPNQIDTVTVRVPPIYKEKRPKKLHRERPSSEEYESEGPLNYEEEASDTEGYDSYIAPRTEPPKKRKKRRKQSRKTRSIGESEAYTAGDYDYYGNKLPKSNEEKYFMRLTVPPPTKDADLARHEKPNDKHFLDDPERLKNDPERLKDDRREAEAEDDDDGDDHRADESERSDELERADETERSVKDQERTNNKERADESERTDKLSPNAKVHETGYQNNYVHATNVQVDNDQPKVSAVKRKRVKIGKA